MGNVYEQQSKSDPVDLEAKQTHGPSLGEEINELQAGIGVLKAAVKKREEVVQKETQHAEQTIESLRKQISMLESKLKEAEETVLSRDNEISNLKAQLQVLRRGINEISSFVNTAEDPTSTERNNFNTKDAATKSPRAELKNPMVTSEPTTDQKPMPPIFFEQISEQLTLIVGPMAAIILRDHVVALGEELGRFPESRLSALLERLSQEISDEKMKLAFRKWFVKHVQVWCLSSGGQN